MKERFLYIDRLKAITIFLVVFGHFIQYNVSDFEHNLLFSMIYSFHMPLFMFISGYVASKTTNIKIFDNYGLFIRKKGISLLLPFFSWQLVANNLFFTKSINTNFLNIFLDAILKSGGLWFLWFLFFLSLLYSLFLFISLKVLRKNSIYIDFIIIAFILGCLLLVRYTHAVSYIDSFILYFLFFFIGVVIARYEPFKKFILNQNTFTFFATLFLLSVGHYEFGNETILNLLLKVIISSSAIVVFYYISHQFSFTKRLDPTILLWGQNTLVIYAVHFSIIGFLRNMKLPNELLSPFLLLIVASLSSVIIILFCLEVFKIIKLSKILNFLLFGNHDLVNDSIGVKQ